MKRGEIKEMSQKVLRNTFLINTTMQTGWGEAISEKERMQVPGLALKHLS